jgi:NAD(P)H-hydrate epimerase
MSRAPLSPSGGEGAVLGDYLWDRAFARAVDRLTSSDYLILPDVLMENAGRAVAEVVLAGQVADRPVLVLAGFGNNGGDALVAARYLAEAGAAVHVFTVARGTDAKPTPSCSKQLAIMDALGHAVTPYHAGVLKAFHKHEPVIVDGVLGIGFEGALDDESLVYAALAEAAELQDATVYAVDVPSGLDADTGDAQEIPLRADVTITFGGRKPAHVLAPARDLCGDVLVADIGFPHAAQDAALGAHRPLYVLPDPDELVRTDPWAELPRSANKYDRGHVLVIGGSAGKTGAPLLAATAALRAGAGWASVAMPQSALASLKGDVPRELTFEDLFTGDDLNPLALATFLEERKVRAVVCGPGTMGSPLGAETLAVLADFTREQGGFVVLDAGATHGLSSLLSGGLVGDPERWLVTPHPGEWRKIGPEFDFTPLSSIGLARARQLAERLGVALLYKHATPILIPAHPSAPGFVAAEGSMTLARAGSGDLLAGVAGAHGAAGLTTAVTALRSQVVVAWAAQLAAERVGEQAVLASDILHDIGNVPRRFADEEADEGEDEDDDN